MQVICVETVNTILYKYSELKKSLLLWDVGKLNYVFAS